MLKIATDDSKGLMLKLVSNSQSLMLKIATDDPTSQVLKIVSNNRSLVLKIATDDSMCQMLEIVSNSRSLMLKIATNHPSGQVAAASESKVNLLEPPVTGNGRPSQVDPRPELDVVGQVCRSPSPADVRST